MGRKFRNTVAAAVLAGGLIPAGTGEVRAQSPLLCYEAAEAETLLSQEEAIRLCCGLESTAPVACYVAATEQSTLDSDSAIELCECSVGDDAAECYLRTRSETVLDEDRAIELCKQTLTPVLPIPATPPVRGELPEERALEDVEGELGAQTEIMEEQTGEQQSLEPGGSVEEDGTGQEDGTREIESELRIIEQELDLLEQRQELLERERELLLRRSEIEPESAGEGVSAPAGPSSPVSPQSLSQ